METGFLLNDQGTYLWFIFSFYKVDFIRKLKKR